MVLFCSLAILKTADAAETVTVTLPDFPVQLNGQMMDNSYSRYPMIVYKNITYVPMTYYDSRLMGLESVWTSEQGLVIKKTIKKPFYEYMSATVEQKNARQQLAKLAEGTITVNGKRISNQAEEYPVLVFREVTYFPLTWHFAVNEFGWQYEFGVENGLVINAPDVICQNPNAAGWILGEPANSTEVGMAGIKLYFDQYPATQEEYNNGRNVSLTKLVEDNRQNKNKIQIISHYPKLVFEDLKLEYRITKLINGHEQLVYRYVLPIYKDPMKYQLNYFVDVGYWQSGLASPGKYKISLIHPDHLIYKLVEENDTEWLEEHGKIELKDEGFDPLRSGISGHLSQDSYLLNVTK